MQKIICVLFLKCYYFQFPNIGHPLYKRHFCLTCSGNKFFNVLRYQKIVSKDIDERLLRWKGVQATEALARSPNAKIVIIGTGTQGGLPLILNPTVENSNDIIDTNNEAEKKNNAARILSPNFMTEAEKNNAARISSSNFMAKN